MAASLQLEQKDMPLLSSIEITRVQQVIAFVPLILVGVMNKVFTIMIPKWYPNGFDFSAIGMKAFGKVELSAVVGIWSVELALDHRDFINAFIILETSSNWISSWIEYKYWWSATCNNEYRS